MLTNHLKTAKSFHKISYDKDLGDLIKNATLTYLIFYFKTYFNSAKIERKRHTTQKVVFLLISISC